VVITTLPRARRVVVAVIAALAALGIGSAASSAGASTLGMSLLELRLPRSLPLIDDAQAVQDLNEQRAANGISGQVPLRASLSSAPRLAVARSRTESVAAAHRAKDATLRIVVRALPRSLSAKIVLAGPLHLHRRVAHSISLKLPAGVYTLSVGPVKATAGAYYATALHERPRLRTGKVTTVMVSYATLVPKTTVVVPAGATSSLTGDPSGPRVLTITGAAARAVRVGDSLSSGVTSAAPYGYLVKVTKIVHKAGSSATLDVENTTLLAALPTGEINAGQALEPTAEAASAGDLRRVNLTLGRRIGGAQARAAGFTINTENLECESSAGVHLGRPTLTFSPSMAVHASWGFFKLDSASISVTVAESLSFGATADAGAHCSTSSPGIGLFPHPITLGTFDIQVGPVPVTVTPKLQVYLSGQATIEAKATFSLEQRASVTVGASYEHGSFHPISSLSQHFTPAFTAEGDASGELALTPTVDTLIYDVAGPSFDVGAVAKLNANVKESPWWTLQGCLQAGLGFVISPLGLNWSDPHLIELCKTLLSATSGSPSSGGASGGGGSGGNGESGGGGSSPPGGDGPGSGTVPTTAKAITAGYNTCALLSGGSVDCWGNNEFGELGDGTNPGTETQSCNEGDGSCSTIPVAVSGIAGATQVSAGPTGTTCALLSGGSVDCWGRASEGELGDGTNTGPDSCVGGEVCSTTPVAVRGITDATYVSVGSQHTCALLSGGEVECWGFSEWLGDGDVGSESCPTVDSEECSTTPKPVNGIVDATQIGTAGDQTCALLSNGHVDCWGSNVDGELGDGTTLNAEVPVAVSGITDATQITAGLFQTCALLSGGGVDCWGDNAYGELGIGTTTGPETCENEVEPCSKTSVPVSGLTHATQISSGGDHTCALLSGGSIDCWGQNEYGELGNGTNTGPESCYTLFCSSRPMAVNGITAARQITAGDDQTCALLAEGGLDCWGYNGDGELGDGTTTDSDVPVSVSGLE